MGFSLSDQPIQPVEMSQGGAGGFVLFEGKVRDHADGRGVLRLEYEAYPELAQSEGDKLVAEAINQFDLIDAIVIHRTGTLEIGETAVTIQTAAPHRREAFAACEWIIDQLKFRVPIWKRETYQDGDSGWVGADAASPATDNGYFDRQQRLSEVREVGQQKLLHARVLLVGVGGLGAGSLPYLVGAGIGTIGLVDDDVVDLSNLHRQVIYQAQDTGRSKIERAAVFSKRLRPGVNLETHPVRLDESNVDTLVAAYDWIVDGTDSLRVKALLNAACRRHGKPLVSASVHRLDGQLMTVMPDGPCLNCLFPDLPTDDCVGTCAETGVLGVVPGLLGVMQANEVLKGILGFGELLSHRLLLVDLRTGETTSLNRSSRPNCTGCKGQVGIQKLDFCFDSIAAANHSLKDLQIIDIRDRDELPELPIPHLRIPVSEFNPETIQQTFLLVCASGKRSFQLAAELRHKGISRAYSLNGGVEGLNDA